MFFFLSLGSQISEVPRLIAAKLCHMIGIGVEWSDNIQKFGGRSPKNIGGQNMQNFRTFLQRPTLNPNISGTTQDIQIVIANFSRSIPPVF